jgi:hypothetical protein
MAAHAAPLESQRAHRNAYVFTGPVHSPGSAVSDPPSTAAPAIDGGVERTGGLFPGGLRPLAVEIVTRATTTRRREMWRRRRGISRCIGGLYGFFTPSFSSAACGTRLHVEEFGNDHFRLLRRYRHGVPNPRKPPTSNSPRALRESLSLRRSTWMPPRSSPMMS